MRPAALLVLLVAAAPAAAQAPIRITRTVTDSTPYGRFVYQFSFRFAFQFNPDFVMNQEREISLARDQRTRIASEVQAATDGFPELRRQLRQQQATLDSLVEQPVVSEAAAMQALDSVLRLEAMVKRSQLRLLIRTKNTLTPAQQERLRRIAEEGQ